MKIAHEIRIANVMERGASHVLVTENKSSYPSTSDILGAPTHYKIEFHNRYDVSKGVRVFLKRSIVTSCKI